MTIQPDTHTPNLRVTLQPDADLFGMDREYGRAMGRPFDTSVFEVGMALLFLKSRYTPTSPSEHVCEDLVEAVVERIVGPQTLAMRIVSINGRPRSGGMSARVGPMSRYLLKRKCLPGEYPTLLDPMRLPWDVSIYAPPTPRPIFL